MVILERPDFAIGEYRHLHRIRYFRHPLPMRGRLVTIGLGPRVHHHMGGTGVGQGAGAIDGAVRAVVAQAHLRGHRNVRRHRAAHGLDDAEHQLGLLEQHRAATGAVHCLGRAAKIQVDHRRTQFAGLHGVLRQQLRIGAEQLHAHRHAGARLAAVRQFRGERQEGRRRQQSVIDADEFGDAPVDAADAGQHIAEDVIYQPLHRGQGDLHGEISGCGEGRGL